MTPLVYLDNFLHASGRVLNKRGENGMFKCISSNNYFIYRASSQDACGLAEAVQIVANIPDHLECWNNPLQVGKWALTANFKP